MDWRAFNKECTAHLPVYARPAFIRITAALPLTSTFKVQKGDLVKEGYDLDKVHGEPVYFYNAKTGDVTLLTKQIMQQINTGVIQL